MAVQPAVTVFVMHVIVIVISVVVLVDVPRTVEMFVRVPMRITDGIGAFHGVYLSARSAARI